jgi:tetratricopeptide (TPR) repeat protein
MTHLSDEILMAYLFDASRLSDRTQVEIHIAECEECRDRLTLENAIEGDLRDRRVWGDVEQFQGRPARLDHFLAEARRIEKEDGDAARRLAPLFKSPLAFDDADIVSDRRFHTEGVVRKLCAEAERLHDRRPKLSLEYATAAADIAKKLYGSSASRMPAFATAMREQATALRFLGEFKKALMLLDQAEALFEKMPGGAYDLAVAWYVRSSVLLQLDEVDKNSEALSLVQSASAVFSEYGDDPRLLRAKILEAVCFLHMDRAVDALSADENVMTLARSQGDRNLLAYGFKNAAEALVTLGDLEKAERYYSEALTLYDELGVLVESARCEWLLARVLGMRGDMLKSAESLEVAKLKLLGLGLRDDHALATLDWSEMRLALDRPDGVAEACRQIFVHYESEAMTRNARLALACLHEALRKGQATPRLVRDVREYLALLPRYPDRPFVPSTSAFPS